MKLSILIPTLTEREDQFTRLKAHLLGQLILCRLESEVEILSICDNREKSTGRKRQELLEMAKGDYIVFIDDDDKVHERYVEIIMDAIKTNPDVLGIRLTHFMDGSYFGSTIHSMAYKAWLNVEKDDGTWEFYRNPNHLNPVKRELALKAGFKDIYIGEDKEYSMKLLPYLTTQVMIEHVMYHYLDKSKK